MQKPTRIWVFFGLIASGKSTVAEKWAMRHEMTYLNSDRIRKELAGVAPTISRKDPVGRGIYTSHFSRQTYDELLTRAEQEIVAGGRA